MTGSDIVRRRLANQQIARPAFDAPVEIVAWLGAVQAQDYAMAKWAVGLRLPGATDAIVEKAVDDGAILRTHVLRPTWHFVAAADIRWMLRLTAPHVKKAASSMNRKLELDEAIFKRTNRIIAKALSGGKHLTRQELMAPVNGAGIATDAVRAAHIMARAELDGIVCSGPVRNKRLTYALMDERVPPPVDEPARDEALAMLAERYFSSRGPATIKDFAWWSGLNQTDARSGLEAVKKGLISQTADDGEYWFPKTGTAAKAASSVHLLPGYDEFLISYKDRTATLPPDRTKHAITGNGIFKPIVLVNGKAAGMWKRSVAGNICSIELRLFDPARLPDEKALLAAAGRYAAFLNREVRITV